MPTAGSVELGEGSVELSVELGEGSVELSVELGEGSVELSVELREEGTVTPEHKRSSWQ